MAQSYIAVPEDEEKLLSTLGSEDGSLARSDQSLFKTTSLTAMLHWTAHISTLILLAFLLVRQTNGTTSDSSRGNHELYSPAFGNSQRPLHYEVFKSAFWQNTIYKAYPGPPSNETLAVWNHITDTPAMNLTADEISRLGLSTDYVQWPKSAGGGYIAFLESAHQLHCLQSLWMRHHYDKDPDLPIYAEMREKIESMPDIEEAHFEHCVDVIRQRLMCTADAAIVTFRWVKGISTPYPNFHSGHMCADYEGLLEWGKERKANMSKVKGWDYHVNLGDGDVEIDHLPR